MQKTINSQAMLKVGTMLRGIYRIDSYLSSGGFGNTYVATNVEFNERVAIKEFFMRGITQRDDNQTTVSVSNADNQDSFREQREKFKKEARRLRQLSNPHIVSVHDLFEENGTAYYVMDYVDGENLAERLRRTGQPMTEGEVGELLPQILSALKSVHDASFWHLDLKPANIMVDRHGQVRLIDFGASKQLNAQKGGATTSTAISYTHGYAPREQMEQNYDKFGPWTDLYALGATLYTLLTNKRPPLPTDIDDDTSSDKHLALPFSEAVSEEMKHLVLWMMSTNRMQRPLNVNTILKRDEKETADISNNKNEETIVFSQQSAQPIFSKATTGTINGFEWVDLGLPSGTKWATRNVGASIPSDYGKYYAWGEYVEKKSYTEGSYSGCHLKIIPTLIEFFRDIISFHFTYLAYGIYKEYEYSRHEEDISGSIYDAAQHEMGGTWRIPTKAEMEELIDGCRWLPTKQDKHQGYQVIGPNGNSIFLPAASFQIDEYENEEEYEDEKVSGYGYYWSSTPNESYDWAAYALEFDLQKNIHKLDCISRYYGFTIRPVSK